MFQSVRPNSQIYIFHKDGDHKFEIGYVVNQPVAKQKYQMPPAFGQPQEMVVDLVVKIGSQNYNYSGIPANADIADSVSNGENIVISDSREAMNAELISIKQKSTDIINSVDYNKKLIVRCDEILAELNPEFAEKQAQKQEMDSLKAQVSDMTKSVAELMEANRRLIERLSHNEK